MNNIENNERGDNYTRENENITKYLIETPFTEEDWEKLAAFPVREEWFSSLEDYSNYVDAMEKFIEKQYWITILTTPEEVQEEIKHDIWIIKSSIRYANNSQREIFYKGLRDELEKYWPDFFSKSWLKKIVLVKWKTRSTLAKNDDNLWWNVQWSHRFVIGFSNWWEHREWIHHELFHEFYNKYSTKDNNQIWKTLWTSVWRKYESDLNTTTVLTPEEDQAIIREQLLAHWTTFTKRASTDSSLRNKIQAITWYKLNTDGTKRIWKMSRQDYAHLWFTEPVFFGSRMDIGSKLHSLMNSKQAEIVEPDISIHTTQKTVYKETTETQKNILQFWNIPNYIVSWTISRLLWKNYATINELRMDKSLAILVRNTFNNKLLWKKILAMKNEYWRWYDFIVQTALHLQWYWNIVWPIDADIWPNTRRGINKFLEDNSMVQDSKFGKWAITRFLWK